MPLHLDKGTLYTVRVRINVDFNLRAVVRYVANIFGSIGAHISPPAHLFQPLRALPAIGHCQFAGWAGVVSEQSKERIKSSLAAVQAEEQVVQLDANTRRAVVALVAQSEENICLAAVSATAQKKNPVTLCGLLSLFDLDTLLHGIEFMKMLRGSSNKNHPLSVMINNAV